MFWQVLHNYNIYYAFANININKLNHKLIQKICEIM